MDQINPNPSEAKVDDTGGPDLTPWVRAAQDGSREAFERLVLAYRERVFRMVYYRVRSRADAEDLTQDIFVKAYRSLGSLKAPDKFQGWLFSIAVNRSFDFLRRRKLVTFFTGTRTEDEGEIERPAPDSPEGPRDLARRQFWDQVGRLFQRLSRGEREVFTLRFMDDLGIREISEVLGQSESTVKTHLYRAMKKFKNDGSLRDYLLGEST